MSRVLPLPLLLRLPLKNPTRPAAAAVVLLIAVDDAEVAAGAARVLSVSQPQEVRETAIGDAPTDGQS